MTATIIFMYQLKLNFMNAKKLLFGLALLACACSLFSCNEKNEEKIQGLNIEQADAAIQAATNSFNTTSNELAQTEGSNIFSTFQTLIGGGKGLEFNPAKMANLNMNKLFTMGNTKSANSNYYKYFTYLVNTVYYSIAEGDNGEILYGTFTLNEAGNITSYNPEPNNAVIFVLPYQNSTAKISYSEIDVEKNGEEMVLKKVVCKAEFNGNTVYNSTFTANDEDMNLDLTMGDFNLKLNYDYTETNVDASLVYNFSIKKNGTTVYNEKETMTANSSALDIVSKLTFGDLEFRIKIFATGSQYQNYETYIGEIADIELYTTNGDKVGELEREDHNWWFYYNDDTRISPEILMNDLFQFNLDFIAEQFN